MGTQGAGVFEKLERAFAIVVGDRLIPGAGAYGVGAVATVMPTEEMGRAFIDKYREDILSLDRGEPTLIAVGQPWQFMRRAASEGLAGIEGANREIFPERFMFMVRVEEAGRDLPTVLASITGEGWGPCMTRTGVKILDHAEILHWERYDILDSVTGQFGQRCPFRDWEHGDALYELRADEIVILLSDVPLLGDWNSTDGAFAFFTSEAEAEHYHKHHLGNGGNRMLFMGGGAAEDPHDAMASLRPTPVMDVRSRLLQLAEIRPFAAWCINPDAHRENAGCGRLHFGRDHPTAFAEVKGEIVPRIGAVSGIWEVKSKNVFELARSLEPWTGRDTIRWSGGQSLQLLPLDRSFIAEVAPAGVDVAELTESEAEELVVGIFDDTDFQASWSALHDAADQNEGQMEQFHVVCWDSVTGDGTDFPWRFPTFLSALAHLAAYEREHDRVHRTEGAISCGYIGISGSDNVNFEDLRSARFELGLRRLAMRVLRNGYRPTDANDLVALANGSLRTLHVDYAGFAKDLLWASTREQEERLLSDLGINECAWEAWRRSADANVDPVGKQLVMERIGEQSWQHLLPKTRHFLSTALLYLKEQGHAPQLDYASISLELVKALEVEIGAVLEEYRRTIEGRIPECQVSNRAEQSLRDFLEGGKPPTLGAMSYLLRTPGEEASELATSLHQFLNTLANANFLTSSKFVKRGLQRVINKFRNGGVHDSPIAEDVCLECVDVVVGTAEKPGFIPLVASWRDVRLGGKKQSVQGA